MELYAGRVGLIANTLADRLLSRADVVVCVGYVSRRATLGSWFGCWAKGGCSCTGSTHPPPVWAQ